MKSAYRRAMQVLYIACIVLSGLAMVAITLMIPTGVFMRYVMNNPLQWPEPASVIMMVFFSFVGGAAVYRANAQIAVEALSIVPDAQGAELRTAFAEAATGYPGVTGKIELNAACDVGLQGLIFSSATTMHVSKRPEATWK